MPQIRHFHALLSDAPQQEAFVEYDGRFVCRQFEQQGAKIFVAPYDIPFQDMEDPTALPSGRSWTITDMRTFEIAWEGVAQLRLSELVKGSANLTSIDTLCLLANLTGDIGWNGAGQWYAEFSNGIARRQFEVNASGVLVAPFDLPFADQYVEILQSMSESDTSTHGYITLSFKEFEAIWEEQALPRLRELAGLVTK